MLAMDRHPQSRMLWRQQTIGRRSSPCPDWQIDPNWLGLFGESITIADAKISEHGTENLLHPTSVECTLIKNEGDNRDAHKSQTRVMVGWQETDTMCSSNKNTQRSLPKGSNVRTSHTPARRSNYAFRSSSGRERLRRRRPASGM